MNSTDPEKQIRLLIADDDNLQVSLQTRFFSRNPAFLLVGVAHDGQETVELAAKLQPDLILLDFQMPIMDGFAALAEIRRRIFQPRVIMTSTHDLSTDPRTNAADGFHPKGKPLNDLLSLIQKLFS